MKKKMKKVGIIIMAVMTMISMNACSDINKETAERVCDILEEKYGQSFAISKIGDRLNNDTAKLYVYPIENTELLFTARIDKDTDEVVDDYLIQKVNFEVEKILRESFDEQQIDIEASSMVVTNEEIECTNKEYTPKAFSDTYALDHYTIYMLINDKGLDAEKLMNALQTTYDKVGVKLVVISYLFENDEFEKCSSEMKNNPEMSLTMIKSYSSTSNFSIKIDGNGSSLTLEELSKMIVR